MCVLCARAHARDIYFIFARCSLFHSFLKRGPVLRDGKTRVMHIAVNARWKVFAQILMQDETTGSTAITTTDGFLHSRICRLYTGWVEFVFISVFFATRMILLIELGQQRWPTLRTSYSRSNSMYPYRIWANLGLTSSAYAQDYDYARQMCLCYCPGHG